MVDYKELIIVGIDKRLEKLDRIRQYLKEGKEIDIEDFFTLIDLYSIDLNFFREFVSSIEIASDIKTENWVS